MKLLLVEDEEDLVKSLRRGLREAGYDVDTALNGEDGLKLATSNQYDCIILDLRLPRMNGLEVCRKIRNAGVESPVLMLTVVDLVDTKVKCLDAGADDYLTKPFSFAELLARIRALVRRKKFTSSMLQVEDLILDPVSRSVVRGGRKIFLSPREYELLHYLMSNRGKVLTRDEIGREVWGIYFDTKTNYIDVYIRYLRRKIDEGFKKKLIHTVRGVGYLFGTEEDLKRCGLTQ